MKHKIWVLVMVFVFLFCDMAGLSVTVAAADTGKAPSAISMNKEKWTLNIKDVRQLKVVSPKGFSGSITWSSSNKAIVSVDKNGTITARKAGTATIKAKTANGKTASCKVTVRPNASKIQLEKSSLRLVKNSTKTLTIEYTPAASKERVIWSSSNTAVAKVNMAGKITAVGAGSCYITAKTANSEIKTRCKVTVYVKQIAITFDDGPKRTTTERLLDGLKKRGVHATFFLIGEQVPDCADLVKRMKNEGHEIGNHSYTHPQLTQCSVSKIESELNKTRKAIKKACGSYPTLFRAPYGSYNDTVLKIADLPHIFWSVDTRDWSTRNTASVRKAIVEGAEDGAIILLHDIYDTTVDGALAAIDDLKKQGYEFVTVTQLLTRGGKKITSGKTYYND